MKKAALPVRERILKSAQESFYREGIRAIGVDTLIARSGVAKMSFYRSFRSKDALVCAYLERFAAEYWKWWEDVVRSHGPAAKRQLRALFAATVRAALAPGHRGCPFNNALAEFPVASHPARRVVARFKAERHARLRELAKAAAARDPARFADELDILLEGARFQDDERTQDRAAALVRAADLL